MATQDMVAPLYHGKHVVVYRNGNHRYYVGNRAIPSVTTILGRVIAKPDLLLWPLNLGLTYLSERLPNITAADIEMARSAHTRRRESGANTGTAVHYLAEQRLKMGVNNNARLANTIENLPEEVVVAALAFEQWFLGTRPQIIGIEQIVYSPTLSYAGTYDCILKINGRMYLCDIKTNNAGASAPQGIYAEHFLQMGAYYLAYEEQRAQEAREGKTTLVEIEDFMVISVKKTGKVDTMTASSVGLAPKQAVRTWQAVMRIYSEMDRLKRRIKVGASP